MHYKIYPASWLTSGPGVQDTPHPGTHPRRLCVVGRPMSASSLSNRLHRPGLRGCGRGNLGNGFARVCGHARSIRATRRTSLPYPIILVHPVQHVESATPEPGEKLVTGEAPAAAAVAWSAAVAPSPAASAACAPSLLPLFVAAQYSVAGRIRVNHLRRPSRV